MGVRFRKRINIIPGVAWLNASKSGVTRTVKLGPLTHNSRTGWRLDLPGPLYWVQGRKKGAR